MCVQQGGRELPQDQRKVSKNVLHYWWFVTDAFQHLNHTTFRTVMRPNSFAQTGSQRFWILEITHCPHIPLNANY